MISNQFFVLSLLTFSTSFLSNFFDSMDHSKDDGQNLRVASFSAYLNSTDENFVLKLTAGAAVDPSEAFSPKETLRRTTSLGRSKAHDQEGEIGVFAADNYFKMNIDHYESTTTTTTTTTSLPGLRTTGSTPRRTVTSESSSWNSQTALLPSLLKKQSRIKQKKAIGRRFFSGFVCSGQCLDRKSVFVEDGVSHGTVSSIELPIRESFRFAKEVLFDGIKQDDDLAFSVEDTGKENSASIKQSEEEPRDSLEVFGSSKIRKGDIAANLERKLSMLTWDAIPKPKVQKFPSSVLLGIGGPCDDIQSDASSDLFEIDTLSGTANHPLLLTMQETDVSCYEPSEASIEWSVVTASAADYDEKSVAGDNTTSKTAQTKNIACKEGRKGRPGGLLGCKSHKAVSVAETAHRTNGEKMIRLAKSVAAAAKPPGDMWRKEDFEFAVPVQRSLASLEMSP